MRLLGAILAGGRSRRFGSDKAAALLDGRPLIDHVAGRLATVCDAVVVCGGSHPHLRTIADSPTPGLGPLGGLSAALDLALADGFDAVLSAPCDAPDLPGDLLARLMVTMPAHVATQPVIGLWPAALAPRLRTRLLEGDDRSLRGWVARAGSAEVMPDTPLANINTPADLAALALR